MLTKHKPSQYSAKQGRAIHITPVYFSKQLKELKEAGPLPLDPGHSATACPQSKQNVDPHNLITCSPKNLSSHHDFLTPQPESSFSTLTYQIPTLYLSHFHPQPHNAPPQ